jgi:hypothetical protein
MTSRRSLIALMVGVCLSCASSALADAVVDWNAITSQAVVAAGTARPGPSPILDFAVVHAAVYDAVQAIEGKFEPYSVEIPGASGSAAAAAAKAAHDVLVNRFPAQAASLDTTYLNYLASHGLAQNDPGVAVGQQAAAGIIALRANDGGFPNPPPPPFVGGEEPGQWRPTPSYLTGPPAAFSPMLVPWLATVTPFTLNSPHQFRSPKPPGLKSSRYTRDYKEIKALGGDVNSERTQEQTDIALFWALNYVVQWNLALRDVATANVDNISDNSRLFALANFAGADALIASWDTKVRWVSWRPVTAIQEGDSDGNPKTHGDVNWRPLINTPNYPDQSSGANAVTGAMTRALKLFFGTDHLAFVVTSNNPLAIPPTRAYSRFSDAARDVVDARVYQGIHFRFADLAGRKQGRYVARWGFKNFLRPIHGDPGCDDDDDDEDEED